MTTKQVSILIMGIAFMFLIGWDIFVATNSTDGDTISEIVRAASYAHPIIVAAICLPLGILIGHWWWAPPDAPLPPKGPIA